MMGEKASMNYDNRNGHAGILGLRLSCLCKSEQMHHDRLVLDALFMNDPQKVVSRTL